MRTSSSAQPFLPARSSSRRAPALATLGSTVGTLGALSVTLLIIFGSMSSSASAQSLRGSHRAVNKPYHYATLHDLPFSRTSRDVKRRLHEGYLVRLGASPDYVTHDVSFPYVTRTTLTFVRRLAAQYHRGCGEKLVITSAVRPESMQPSNSSEYSVHPAGIAVDFRKPRSGRKVPQVAAPQPSHHREARRHRGHRGAPPSALPRRGDPGIVQGVSGGALSAA